MNKDTLYDIIKKTYFTLIDAKRNIFLIPYISAEFQLIRIPKSRMKTNFKSTHLPMHRQIMKKVTMKSRIGQTKKAKTVVQKSI